MGVKVISENPITGIVRHTTTAYLTFVALDDLGHPVEVSQVITESDDEKRRFDEGKMRMDELKKKAKKS